MDGSLPNPSSINDDGGGINEFGHYLVIRIELME